jgi:histidyl-tRNA synthetase
LSFFKIGYKLQLNSLGCKDCMPDYKKNLIKHLDKLSLSNKTN